MRTNKRTFPPAEVLLSDRSSALDLAQIFVPFAPLEVDLGCGDGSFLVGLAQQNAERNFLGIERMAGRVRAACRRIGDGSIPNARVMQAEILEALERLLPEASVETFHLMFPDPWPKRRHHGRRVFDEAFLKAIARALRAGGMLRIATDDAGYFTAMQQVLRRSNAPLVLHSEHEIAPLPASTFERRFREKGAPIHQVTLRKVSVHNRVRRQVE